MTRRLGALMCASVLVVPTAVSGQVPGIVVVPFHTDSAVYGEAGQLLDYVDRGLRLDLLLDGDTIEVRAFEGKVVPFDSVFTPALILAAFRECEPFCNGAIRRGRPQMVSKQERLRLVQRALELFPEHAYAVEFRAIECTMLVPLDSKMRGTEAIECAGRFVQDYSEHHRAGEMAWLATRLEHAVYEFEGDTGAMRAQAEAFASFADSVADPSVADAVRLRVARLYYMIQEVSGGDERAAARRTALGLYDTLSGSSEESVRLEATIQRFNLLEGRRIYVNPNSWTCAPNDPC